MKHEDSVFGEFIRCIWSFGNLGKTYIFGKDKESWKNAGHLFLTELDVEGLKVFKDMLGHPRSLKEMPKYFENLSLNERLSIWVNVILKLVQQLSPKISFSSLDFREVKIETPIAETIIYCDPPYKGTTGYGKASFNSDSFFEWCAKNEYNVFVSEYAEIEDLHKIFEVKKRALLDKNATHCVDEKLFFNKKTTLF